MPRFNMQKTRTRWPLPLRLLIACAVGVTQTCLIYWENWHRQAGNAAFVALVDDYGMSFRTSQPVAEVVLVSVLCVPGLLVALYAFHRLSRRPAFDGETRRRACGYILRGLVRPVCPECGEGV